MGFFESFFLWKEAVISSFFLSVALSTVGTYTILRRVVFLPAALSQLSGSGVMAAFWLASALSLKDTAADITPLCIALVFTITGAVALGRFRTNAAVSRETAIGIVYILASAAVILLAGVLPQEAHHVDDILFGNAVLVDLEQMFISSVTAVLIIIVQVRFRHEFMLISYDEETAIVHGLSARKLSVLLFVNMALLITVATRTIGALPTFAFTVLPPWIALQRCSSTTGILLVGSIVAGMSSFLGYWISFSLDLPTGATTSVCIGLFAALLILPPKLADLFRAGNRKRA